MLNGTTSHSADNLIHTIRDRFWYVQEDSRGRKRIFFDNAAGSLVLKHAQAAIDHYSRVSSYGGALFTDSRLVDDLVQETRHSVAMLLNAGSSHHIFTGESTTAVLRRLAEAILASLPDRSRLLVSAADHNANIDPWRKTAAELSQKHFDLQILRFDPSSGTADLNHLETFADERLRVVAVSHASNTLGAENPIRQIREVLDRKSPAALLIVDGVHFVPHGPVDVQAMGADAYVFSSYKIFAQRGLSYACISERISPLPHYKLTPAPDTSPESWELGFRNPADFAPMIEVVDYLAWLGPETRPGAEREASRDNREKVRLGQATIRQYENLLVRTMLDGTGTTPGLKAIEGVTVYGAWQPEFYHLKEPTFAFNVRGRSADEVAAALWNSYGIAIRSGDHYAVETHKQLGVTESARASLAHYNTPDEVKAFLEAVAEIAAGAGS